MVEYVGKVKVNLDFYSGNDLYCDGEIEDEFLDIVKKDLDIIEVLANDNRWPILYHFTPQRRNLLEWYPFEKDASILEIGAGCGALTGLFCEKSDKVIAIELSKKRAEIIANRYKDKSNLEIIVGNIADIKLQQKFDYITLIGVLEYAGKYITASNPFLDFLTQLKRYLKPGGCIIIAIENKFGLKYWAGSREDHTGLLFENLENYNNCDDIITFSKDELSDLINNAGMSKLEFYYPMPDYKIPMQIFSDYYLPKIGQLKGYFPNYDQGRLKLFNERLVYDNIIINNKLDFFANSFLVFCSE